MEQAFSAEVLGCALDRWALFWGDPMLPASASMLVYGLGGLLLLRAGQRTDGPDRQLWRVCAALFFLQVANTHVDLHAFPGAYGRCLALAQGWYEHRGPVKMLGAVLVGAAILTALIVAAVAWWRSIRANILLVAGVAVALGCTLVRGAGLDGTEPIYDEAVGPFRWADLIEYGGVGLAAFAAQRRLRHLRRPPRAGGPADAPEPAGRCAGPAGSS